MATFDASAQDARLDFPLSPEQKQLLEEAAAIRGQSVPEFALTTLLPLAQETVEQGEPTRLSVRDRDLFLQLLETPPEPNQSLQRAAQRYRERRA
jgi:uncharacterized protein (DUF1778 family)